MSISEIRSISTPDLKRVAALSEASTANSGGVSGGSHGDDDASGLPAYEAFCDDCEEEVTVNGFNASEGSEDDSDSTVESVAACLDNHNSGKEDWGSADELDHHVLKSFRRPLRPAAAAKAATTPKKQRTVVRKNGTKECDSDEKAKPPPRPPRPQQLQSVYIQKKAREGAGKAGITLPKNPFGFDSALASQVATKAKMFTGFTKKKAEEVFGDSSD